MRLAVLGTGLALLAACGGAGSEVGPRATASTIATNPAEGSASISSSPTTSSSPTAWSSVSLNCQLAVYQVGRQKTGFIRFPGGKFVEDPAGAMVEVPAPTDRAAIALTRTIKQPELQGPGGPFYSKSAARWLPVEREAVSPDGLRYAYAEPYWSTASYPSGSRVHVVNVATGLDRVIYDVASYKVVSFASEGIYVQQWSDTGRPVRLALLNPSGGQPKQIFQSDTLTWTIVEAGAAWGKDLGSSSLTRLDLMTGNVQTWFHSPDSRPITIVAVDSVGAPFVVHLLNSPAQELFLVSEPNMARVVVADFKPGDISVAHDSHGIWFGGPDSNTVSIYTPQSGMTTIATIGQDPGQEYLWVVGGCA
jgi:hypothetical protein